MEKELLQQAFEAGVEYQKQFESKLAETYDKPNFDQWYDKLFPIKENHTVENCDLYDRKDSCELFRFQKDLACDVCKYKKRK